MILDIRFIDKAPEQVQGVRMITFYMVGSPEAVIQFDEYTSAQRNIPLDSIIAIQVTND